ncbi:molybdopterin-dependent oxidoreductase [Curtanaerobium respiraculi]|uniref:molybdopterin-dependent oxidoreductase n=1 Tax=Curtanaerobium respiraculi TaxID=2949669 RepID=UPI0024B35A1E|nr:molybdopterin-dependent oxidoreductase [Curtanaerobium respiraculi]
MELTRRNFVKSTAVALALAAAGASGAALTGCAGGGDKKPASTDGATTYHGVCRFCGTGCGVIVKAKNGKIVSVQGDPDNVSNKGLNCVKGYYLGSLLYGEDRLTKPLIRDDSSTKGSMDGFREASWDEALDLVAEKMKTTWKNDKSRMATWLSGQQPITEAYACAKMWKAGLRCNNIDPNARLCMASAVVGFMNVFQTDEPAGCYQDLDLADTFVTWGANMAEAHPVLYSRFMAHKESSENVKQWDLTTLRTRTSANADKVLVFRPGSDIAIANAICNYLIVNDLYDHKFVEDHLQFKQGTENIGNSFEDGYDKSEIGSAVDNVEGITFEQFAARLAPYTLEYASQVSGVPAADIEGLAKEFADPSRKIMSLWTMGVNQHNRGTWMNHCIYNIHLLTGKIAKPGNGPFSLTGQPSACGTAREVGTFSHRLPADLVVKNPQHRRYSEAIWNLPENWLEDIKTPGMHTTKIFREMSKGNLDFLWTAHNNWAVSMPNLTRFLGVDPKYQGVYSCFTVVNEVYPTKSCEYADVVFPVAMWMEREGQFGNGERHTTVFEKAADAPGEAKWDLWVFMEVWHRVLDGEKIGEADAFDLLFGNVYDKNAGDFVNGDDQHATNRILWDEYRIFSNPELNEKALAIDEDKDGKFGAKLHMHGKQLAPYDEYFGRGDMVWPMRDVNGEWLPTYWRFGYGPQEEGYDQVGIEEYGTLGLANDVSFYKSAKQRPSVVFRPYEPPAQEPSDEYPFWFCTGRLLEHWHTGSMTMRIPELKRALPESVLYMNKGDAGKLGVSTGDEVNVTSTYGTVKLHVDTGGRVDPDPGMTFAAFFDDSHLVNLAVEDVYCPLSKEPDFKKTCVKIEKA